jgi:predicted DNA-binding transcriptional regulator AlpA
MHRSRRGALTEGTAVIEPAVVAATNLTALRAAGRISGRLFNTLSAAGYIDLRQLDANGRTDEDHIRLPDLRRIPNLGRVSEAELARVMAAQGLRLYKRTSFSDRQKIDPWLTVEDMLALFECSRTTLYDWLRTDETFPRPFRWRDRPHWKRSEVMAYRENVERQEISFGQLANYARGAALQSMRKGK